MSRLTIPFAETMITYACNLSCAGCTNYSDYDTRGYVTWEQGKSFIEPWLSRLKFLDFGLIGGEPLLNPEAGDWLIGCRALMPNTQLRFTTNAVLFDRHQDILDCILDTGNCVFKLSIHEPEEFYVQTALDYIFSKVQWQPVREHGIQRWQGPNGVRLQINFPKFFYKTYQGSFSNMLPHNNPINEAFDICVQKNCPLLYENKLYKCSSIALLPKVLSDWKIDLHQWKPYVDYQGLPPDCSDQELKNWLSNFEKPEWICSMCPSKVDQSSKLTHSTTVQKKLHWIKQNASYTASIRSS